MVRNQRSAGWGVVLLAVGTMLLGACEHDRDYPAARTGSIKDVEPVASRPVRQALARNAVDDQPTARSGKAAAAQVPPVSPPAKAPAKGSSSVPAAPASAATVPASPPQAMATPATPPAVRAQPRPPAEEPPIPPVDDPVAVARLLAEGQRLFDAGRVVEARRRYIAAMNGPVPEVLLALARSYDTYYLSRLPASDGAPDMQRALVLYERAVERGAKDAAIDLDRTRGILRVPR